MFSETQVRRPLVETLLAERDPGRPRRIVTQHTLPPRLYSRAMTVATALEQVEMDVPCLGLATLFDEERVYPGPDRDWVLLPLAEDPSYRQHDGFATLPRVISRLERIRDAGIEFDTLYIAHELPKGILEPGKPFDRRWLLPPPSPKTRHLSERLGDAVQKSFRVAAAPLRAGAMVTAAAGAVAAAAGGAMAPLMLLALLAVDPILFGAVIAPRRTVAPGELAAWFKLASWTYAEIADS